MNHSIITEKLNSISNLGWKASTYDQFKNYTIKNLNKIAGTKKNRGNIKSIPSDVSDLPNNFNKWVDEGYVQPARQQGDCGSCYIMATIAMIETRLRIKYKSFKDSNMRLSVQHPLDCS